MTKLTLSLAAGSFGLFLFIVISFFTGEFLADAPFDGIGDLLLLIVAMGFSVFAYLAIAIAVFGRMLTSRADRTKTVIAAILAAIAPVAFLVLTQC